jgi:hypothetical protein
LGIEQPGSEKEKLMSALSLLMHPDEWENFKAKALEDKGLKADEVLWGNGPTSYPCMAAGFITGTERSPGAMFACCYFYVEQAIDLVRASGIPPTPDAGSRITNVIGPEQAKFNETILAHVATILKVMVDTSITKEEHYNPIFQRELQSIEQRHAEGIEERLQTLRGSLKKDDS